MSINTSIYIIYVHDDVDVSAYEYIHGCVDVCVNDNDYCYCICIYISIYARAGKWKMTFEIINICGKWNSKIGIDIYNRGMKIENRTWQIESNVIYM